MKNLLSQLRDWRNNQARIEGAEGYRVLSNTVLEALVGALPQNKEEMLAIKGIKEAKFGKYGMTLLRMIAEHTGNGTPGVLQGPGARGKDQPTRNAKRNNVITGGATEKNSEGVYVVHDKEAVALGEDVIEQTLSVSEFLDGLNIELSGMAARIEGEVSSVDVRERVVYFTLKDSRDESTLNCLIFRRQYDISGVALTIGDEIIVEGAPDIYKPSGRLSLKVGMIELCGEGALKKAYDALKLKFEEEGLFAPEKKRILPRFPKRIALITSEQGAAIGDFTMNLGRNGFLVDFYPTSVEGKKAVFEIIEALRYFNRHAEKYDVLVMIRGGGSLESLQAFNNEALVREVATLRIPTLLGVGHEKDVTLAALAADVMVSTPTATARTLHEPWEEARQTLHHFEQQLPALFERELVAVKHTLAFESEALLVRLEQFLEQAEMLKQAMTERLFALQALVRQKIMYLDQAQRVLVQSFLAKLESAKKELVYAEDLLRQYDPKRVLKLGYSLVQSGERIVKDASKLTVGDILGIQLSKGKIGVRVETITKE